MTRSPAPGRSCPPEYGYSPSVFARTPELTAEVLYVAGGLYGNLPALREIERMAALEPERTHLVFNGDFHWFDADPEAFVAVDRAVLAHTALRGNVETEIAGDTDGNGCGCAYPSSVSDDDVARSNRMLARLRVTARAAEQADATLRHRLAALPMHLVAGVAGARIGIVHGDAWSLAGWRFAHDRLHDPAQTDAIAAAFEKAGVDGFACSHTCLPALKTYATGTGDRFVINNGSSGMPNFRGTRYGVLTRIASLPVPPALHSVRVYGADIGGLYVDALAVHFDARAFDGRFGRLWPAGSDAAVSYGRRILDGPAFTIDEALGRSASSNCIALAA